MRGKEVFQEPLMVNITEGVREGGKDGGREGGREGGTEKKFNLVVTIVYGYYAL
jgi:hypothetical protein